MFVLSARVCLIESVCRPAVGVVSVGLNPEDHQSFPIDMGRCCHRRCSSYGSCCNRFRRGVGFPIVRFDRRCQCQVPYRLGGVLKLPPPVCRCLSLSRR